jgi:hypothetical protein
MHPIQSGVFLCLLTPNNRGQRRKELPPVGGRGSCSSGTVVILPCAAAAVQPDGRVGSWGQRGATSCGRRSTRRRWRSVAGLRRAELCGEEGLGAERRELRASPPWPVRRYPRGRWARPVAVEERRRERPLVQDALAGGDEDLARASSISASATSWSAAAGNVLGRQPPCVLLSSFAQHEFFLSHKSNKNWIILFFWVQWNPLSN